MTGRGVPGEVRACLTRWPGLIGPEDDGDWQVWADSGFLFSDHLSMLVRGRFRPSIQARALLTLLAPRKEWNPLYWPHLDVGCDNYLSSSFVREIDTIPMQLLPFAADIVTTFCDVLAPVKSQRLDSTTAELLDTLNGVLLRLLERAPRDWQAELLERYRLNLLGEQTYPYLGLIHLLRSGVDELWKAEADGRVRLEVLGELPSKLTDGARSGSALWRYQLAVGVLVKADRLKYSLELLATQVEFLLSDKIREWLRQFSREEIAGFMFHLNGEDLVDLRHRLLRYIVLEQTARTGGNPFIWSGQELGERLLNEFREHDPELGERLITLVGQATRIKKESNQRDQRNKQAEEAVLARLR